MYRLILVLFLVLLSSCRLLTEDERINFVVWLVSQGYVDQKDCLIVDGCLEIDDTDTIAVAAPNTPPGMKFAGWEIEQKGEPNACAGLYNLCAFDSTKYRGVDLVEVFLAEDGPYLNVNPNFVEADMADEPGNQCQNYTTYDNRTLNYNLTQGGTDFDVKIERKRAGLSVDSKGGVHTKVREIVSVYRDDSRDLLNRTEAVIRTLLNPKSSLDYIARESEKSLGGATVKYRGGRRTFFDTTLSDPFRSYSIVVVETVDGVDTEIPVDYDVVYKGHTPLVFADGTEGIGCEWEETQTANHPVFGSVISTRTTTLGGNDTGYGGVVVSQSDTGPFGPEDLHLVVLSPGFQ